MANEEQLEIMKQGVDAWNRWRGENMDVIPNLSGANLRRADLRGADIREANLWEANLWGAILNEANLRRADLREANLWGANLRRANLRRANLSGAILRSADLREANLRKANLREANLREANLWRADLKEAGLIGTDLNWANLNGADLRNASLQSSTIIEANVSGMKVQGSQMRGTTIVNVDLRGVEELESVNHWGPSFVDISTLLLSKGEIPEVFLKGAGWPDEVIENILPLVRKGEYYTCFISYTEADDEFSEKLYSDLKDKGVQCYRWREDAPWGKTLWASVDEAIARYDKLVVICSEDSLQASTVLREIERALQKEDAMKKRGEEGEVLFPIRLDDYVFEEWEHHLKADVVTKYVGDFTRKKEYDKSLERLLRDLEG
jgi:hypothetical protein